MIRFLISLLAFWAAPFWESMIPRDWSSEQLYQMLHDSPWAQEPDAPTKPNLKVQVYLASAKPMQEAEAETRRRRAIKQKPVEDPLAEEYLEFVRADAGKHIILAIYFPNSNALSDAKESTRMQEECVMKVGRKKIKMEGHFPPSISDPYLRLLYPRALDANVKHINFELYLPSLPSPFREVQFELKDMVYRGKFEL